MLLTAFFIAELGENIPTFMARNDDRFSHFDTRCSRRPEADYVQVAYVKLAEGERFCDECAALEGQKFPPKG